VRAVEEDAGVEDLKTVGCYGQSSICSVYSCTTMEISNTTRQAIS